MGYVRGGGSPGRGSVANASWGSRRLCPGLGGTQAGRCHAHLWALLPSCPGQWAGQTGCMAVGRPLMDSPGEAPWCPVLQALLVRVLCLLDAEEFQKLAWWTSPPPVFAAAPPRGNSESLLVKLLQSSCRGAMCQHQGAHRRGHWVSGRRAPAWSARGTAASHGEQAAGCQF